MRQFYLDLAGKQLPTVGETVTLGREESHHLATVLRGGREVVLRLIDGRGHRMTGIVTGGGGGQTDVCIESVVADVAENALPRLVVACAMVKGKRFEWALEKAVELGAHAVIPLICDHGVVAPRSGKQNRWVTIMKSAVKQCGRSWLPELGQPLVVSAALANNAGAMNLFGAAPWETPSRRVRPWTELLVDRPAEVPEAVVFFVGPEGGWSPTELADLSAAAQPISLGPHVLRAETAVAAGVTVLQSLRHMWLAETKT